MGSRHEEGESFAFYDPERESKESRPQIGVRGKSGPPSSQRDGPFGFYDPELDEVRPRQESTGDKDIATARSRRDEKEGGMRDGAYPPLPYMNQNGGHHPGAQGPPQRPVPISEPGPSGRGALMRPHVPLQNQHMAGPPQRGRGEHPPIGIRPPSPGIEAGYPRPMRPPSVDPIPSGRGAAMPPTGAGRYVYGGLRQHEVPNVGQHHGVPPAPISSAQAHQVYATVFSDPVYGGAEQFNPAGGYMEEPVKMQQLHHRQDVLRRPEQF